MLAQMTITGRTRVTTGHPTPAELREARDRATVVQALWLSP
jgi:hypothetical protein